VRGSVIIAGAILEGYEIFRVSTEEGFKVMGDGNRM